MKRLKRNAISIFLVLCILFSSPVKTGAAAAGWAQEYADETYVNIEGTCIYCEPGTDEADIQAGVFAWMLCPESVREALVSLGCRIYISCSSGTDINANGESSSAGFLRGDKTGKLYGISKEPYILARTESDDLTGTILHEMGHLLDNSIARVQGGVVPEESEVISGGAEWEALYAVYGEALALEDFNAGRGADEAFAVAFRLTYEYPEWTAENMPEICDFVSRSVMFYAEGFSLQQTGTQ